MKPFNSLVRRPGAAIVRVAVLAALLAAPWVADDFTISTASTILAYGLLAMSANLLTGVAGLPTLGQAAYFGIGAYTAALVARAVSPVGILQVAAAVALAATVAALVGTIVVRARGVVFLMLTLAVGELAHQAADRWRSVTGGTDGLAGVPRVVPVPGMAPLELKGLVYYYVLAVFLVLFALVALLVRAPFGLALRGIRDNEARMRAAGYPVNGYLLVAHVLAGGLAGAAGALWISVERSVSPGVLGFEVSAVALLAVILGGIGSMWGAVAGAAVVIVARDTIGGDLGGHGPLLLGALFVLAVYLVPRGLAGLREHLPARLLGRKAAG